MMSVPVAMMVVTGPSGWLSDKIGVRAPATGLYAGLANGGKFAPPGHWADASPAEHVAWYHGLGANVIQTFAVSCNGYAWYQGGKVPPQPGLRHDFTTQLVKLGHARGMKVMGYFCVAANTRWGKEHPDLSYGTPATFHLPLTDAYLDYLAEAITEAFRQRTDSIRSDNPTHSVSAIGARAVELTADHGKWGLRPCMYRDEAFAAVTALGLDQGGNFVTNFNGALYRSFIDTGSNGLFFPSPWPANPNHSSFAYPSGKGITVEALMEWVSHASPGLLSFHHSSNHSKTIPPMEFPSPGSPAELYSMSFQEFCR